MKKITALLLCLVIVFTLCSCSAPTNETPTESTSAVQQAEPTGFSAETKAAVDDFIRLYGKDSPDYKGNAYVASDFDNTAAVFDITYQCNIHQLRVMAFAMTPEELKETISAGIKLDKEEQALIEDCYASYSELYKAYGSFTAEGLSDSESEKIQQDKWWQEFSTKMISLLHYIEDHYPDEIAFEWILYWYVGMTEDELYNMFLDSCEKYEDYDSELLEWKSPADIESKAGVKECELILGCSVTDEVKDMYKRMDEAGIDVWICSASHCDAVRGAVDAFGMSNYITGVIGMTQAKKDGKFITDYDYETGYAWLNKGNGKWEKSEYAINAMPAREGKVQAIKNALGAMYKCGPLAGFMDSSGDFNFCTEFDSLKLVICYNRANREITEGGGLVGVLATYQKEALGYDLEKANAAGDTYYVLQGRDENGKRAMRPSDKTIRLGETEEKLFANEKNEALLEFIKENKFSTKDFFDTFAIAVPATARGNTFGYDYGYLEEYIGYHSVSV
jgi:phosphoglycolate phosphatase-like HAD superfamily hydrolase